MSERDLREPRDDLAFRDRAASRYDRRSLS